MNNKLTLSKEHMKLMSMMANPPSGFRWVPCTGGYTFSIGSIKFKDGYISSPWFERFCKIAEFMTGAKSVQFHNERPSENEIKAYLEKKRVQNSERKERMREYSSHTNAAFDTDDINKLVNSPSFFVVGDSYVSLEDAEMGVKFDTKYHISARFVNTSHMCGGEIRVRKDEFKSFSAELREHLG